MILIHRKTGKKIYITEIKDINTHLGIIKKEDLEKAKPYDIIKSHLNEEFIVIEDNLIDLLGFTKRKTQSTHLKDFGLLVSLTGLSSGWKIIELGTGSGLLTALLANIVKPNGRVYTYECRRDFYNIAKENLIKLKLINYVELKLKDAKEGIEEKEADLVVSDIPDPFLILDNIYESLKFGGYFASFLPNVTSILKLLDKNEKFNLVGIYENILRAWKYEKKDVLRPKNKQLVHTEFLVLMRKL
ncbi:MAG: methyltransferase domain-containing protein [Nanopusillaceae archaeon]